MKLSLWFWRVALSAVVLSCFAAFVVFVLMSPPKLKVDSRMDVLESRIEAIEARLDTQ